MKPLSVEMACLLGIQNEIQAVWCQSHSCLKTMLTQGEPSVADTPT